MMYEIMQDILNTLVVVLHGAAAGVLIYFLLKAVRYLKKEEEWHDMDDMRKEAEAEPRHREGA